MTDALSIVAVIVAMTVALVIIGVVAYTRSAGKAEQALERRVKELEIKVAVLNQQVDYLQANLTRTEAERDECRAESKKLQQTNGRLEAERERLRGELGASSSKPATVYRNGRERTAALKRLQTMKDQAVIMDGQITAQGGESGAPADMLQRRAVLEDEIKTLERDLT